MTLYLQHSGEFDLDNALSFLRDNNLNYSHPDWLGQNERLSGPFTYVLEKDDEILAILCTAREDPAAGWIRFFHCLRDGNHRVYFDQLLAETIVEHRSNATQSLFSTGTMEWFANLLRSAGFRMDTKVVTLAKLIRNTTAPVLSLSIRNMEISDFKNVLAVDNLAFSPEWRLDQASLEHTFSHSAIATVGVKSNQVVAYSMTNAFFGSAHLERLAVHPTFWGQRLGGQMLEDLNFRCAEHGINQVTVNTQVNNERSLALYQRDGFQTSGEAIPIYRLDLI
ncbi:MAG: GNAT family N-acetyltransferase [Anaerolineaceae bacterium]